MPDHRGKFALTYEGSYVVKKAFFGGALILANMDEHDFNMPTNYDAVIQYSHKEASKCNLFFYIPKKKKKRLKRQKIWNGRLKTWKGSLGKN